MTRKPRAVYGTMRVGNAQIGIAIDKLAEVVGPIKSLSPIMMESHSLLGGLDLRGDLIPVLDPSLICGAGTAIRDPKFAVILRHEGQLMGIGIDEITGLAQLDDDHLRVFDRMADHDSGVVLGGFLNNGSVTTVLDVPRVFTMVDTLSVKAKTREDPEASDRARAQMLTFEAGGALFALRATEIYGTVPRQVIVEGSMTGGDCIGTITYHDRRIPVLSAVGTLGVGQKRIYREAETVILRFPDDRLVGLAVDAIKTIEGMDIAEFVPLPSVIGHLRSSLSAVRIKDDGSQIYAVNIDAIRQDKGLCAVADLSDPADAAAEAGGSGDTQSQLRERYLLFDADEPMATPLKDVAHILKRPSYVTPLSELHDDVEGFFAHEGHSIPMVDLAAGRSKSASSSEARVLIVGEPGHQVGFAVDRVRSIETSAWFHQYDTGESDEVGSIVQIGSGANARVLERIDLSAKAECYQSGVS